MYMGGCLCGGIRFEIDQEIGPIQICHCVQCRKAQGSAIVTNTPVQVENFRIVMGKNLLASFESSPGKQRCFCKNCGSPIFSETVKLPGVVRIRVGTLDGEIDTKPLAHFFVAHKANWFQITDDLPQFQEGYVPKSDNS